MDKISPRSMVFIGIALFLIVLSFDLYTDLKPGAVIDHKRGAILRTLFSLPCLFCLSLAPNTYKIRQLLAAIACSILVFGFNYWNLFDGLFNVFRGHEWFFTGSEDGAADAKTDNFLQSIPLWLHITIKFGGSIISVYLYSLTFKYKFK